MRIVMRDYNFWIRRKRGDAMELVTIVASNSHEAIANLPQCVLWDFKLTPA